jgi:hypothetical protein
MPEFEMETIRMGSDAVRASVRLTQAIIDVVDMLGSGILSKANADVTAAQMAADMKIVATFVERTGSLPATKGAGG